MLSRDKIAFRTDIKLILNLNTHIEKDMAKGENKLMKRKKIEGVDMKQLDMALLMENPSETADSPKDDKSSNDDPDIDNTVDIEHNTIYTGPNYMDRQWNTIFPTDIYRLQRNTHRRQ